MRFQILQKFETFKFINTYTSIFEFLIQLLVKFHFNFKIGLLDHLELILKYFYHVQRTLELSLIRVLGCLTLLDL